VGFGQAQVGVVLVETIGAVGQEVGPGFGAHPDRALEELDRPRALLLL
jgi:hypothetical protein